MYHQEEEAFDKNSSDLNKWKKWKRRDEFYHLNKIKKIDKITIMQGWKAAFHLMLFNLNTHKYKVNSTTQNRSSTLNFIEVADKKVNQTVRQAWFGSTKKKKTFASKKSDAVSILKTTKLNFKKKNSQKPVQI